MENLRGEDEILEVLFAIGSVHGYTLKICTAQHEHVDMSGILSKLGEKQTRSAACCRRQQKSIFFFLFVQRLKRIHEIHVAQGKTY